MFRLTILVIALLATTLMFTACGDNDTTIDANDLKAGVSVSEEVQDQAANVGDKLDELRSGAVEMAEEKLSDWKGKIDTIIDKKESLSVTAQKLVEKPLNDLTTQYDKASSIVSEIKEASTLDAVNEKKVEFMKSLDSVDGAYKKVTSLL